MNGKRILVWVHNKMYIEKFKILTEHGWNILSTGSSYHYLKEKEVPCSTFDLHDTKLRNPHLKITSASILDNVLSDIVVVNLEMIIGTELENLKKEVEKPLLTIVATFNHPSVTTLTNYRQYGKVIDEILKHGHVTPKTRAEQNAHALGDLGTYFSALAHHTREQGDLSKPLFEKKKPLLTGV